MWHCSPSAGFMWNSGSLEPEGAVLPVFPLQCIFLGGGATDIPAPPTHRDGGTRSRSSLELFVYLPVFNVFNVISNAFLFFLCRERIPTTGFSLPNLRSSAYPKHPEYKLHSTSTVGHTVLLQTLVSAWITSWGNRQHRRWRERKQKRGKQAGIHARLRSSPDRPALPSLFIANAWSIVNKIDKLKLRFHSNKINSCASFFTETWLTPNIPDAVIELTGRTLQSGPNSWFWQRQRGSKFTWVIHGAPPLTLSRCFTPRT